MLRIAVCLLFGGLLVGCDATARTTNGPDGSRTDIKVDTARPRGNVDVDVNPNSPKKVEIDVNKPGVANDKKIEVDVGRGGVQVDVDGKPLRERVEERREERRENAP